MIRPRLARATVGVAAALALTGASLGSITPSQAAPNAAATQKAADFIKAGAAKDPGTDAGALLDAAFGLAAAGPNYAGDATNAYNRAKTLCNGSYAKKNAASASKCAVGAAMVGDQEQAKTWLTPYAATDYTKEYEFGVGLDATGFIRAGMPIPQTLLNRMLQLSTPVNGKLPLDKNFGKQLDAAGLLYAALLKLPDQTPEVKAAQTNLAKYILDNQQADGSWPDYSPVNTTGMVGPAIGLTHPQAREKGQTYVVSKQLADGGFPNKPNGTTSDLRATNEAIFALTDKTLFDLSTVAAPAPGDNDTTPAPTPAPATGTATLLAVANRADCATQGGVWIVIENKQDLMRRGCVKTSGSATAFDALKALTPDVTTKDSKYGPMICTIDGVGNCDFVNNEFWNFYIAPAEGAWTFAEVGAGSYQPVAGTALGFEWGTSDEMLASAQDGDTPFPAAAVTPSVPTPDGSTPELPTPSLPTAAPLTPVMQPGLANTGGSSLVAAR